MNKTLINICVLTLAGYVSGVSAQDLDTTQLEQNMEQLITVKQEGELFVTIDEEASYESIEYKGFLLERFSEIYVSRQQAKEFKLEQASKFYIYGEKDIDTVSRKIEKRINLDTPRFFSVDLYRDYHGQSGEFNFVAKVIEYK
ncbi:hypothetical protein [Shewanella sp. 10N.286.54.B9]|uniref:hypothetical protein n=1 Tax=Shewanella sp. 10N.286.54.B9 TaxID=3229719 RepID=UPI003551F9D8